MNGDKNEADNALRPGEVAIELPAVTDAGVFFIGTIRTPWRTRGECPKRGSADGPICSIEIDARWRAALTDIEQHKRIQVLYWMHRGASRPGVADAVPHRADDRQLRTALAGAPEPDRFIGGRSGGGQRNDPPGSRPRLSGRHAADRPEAGARDHTGIAVSWHLDGQFRPATLYPGGNSVAGSDGHGAECWPTD